jgi:hypothetical protein
MCSQPLDLRAQPLDLHPQLTLLVHEPLYRSIQFVISIVFFLAPSHLSPLV